MSFFYPLLLETMEIIDWITKKDIAEASKTPIPFGAIGDIVDTRTYRRWIPKKGRRETAYERNARVVNYNISLTSHLESSVDCLKEAKLMFKKMNELKADASGRTKWVGGTPSNLQHPASNFNCSALAINRLSAFSDLFELLMLGTGVGFRVFRKDINKLPKIQIMDLGVEFEDYNPVAKEERLQETFIEYDPINLTKKVWVADTRQGWIDALMIYLEAVTDKKVETLKIVYNINSIRPMGERINGFGGSASGHGALVGIIQDVKRIIEEIPGEDVGEGESLWFAIRPIDAMDICCAIAKGVVAGSSRRSALICLFEKDDELVAESKTNLWTDPSKAHKQYRAQSNNTAQYLDKPSLEELKKLVSLNSFRENGEPGIDNLAEMIYRRRQAATKYRPYDLVDNYLDVVTNP